MMARHLPSAAAALALLALAPAQAEILYPTETFEGTPASNAGYYPGAVIPNTALEVVAGPVAVADAGGTQGHALVLFSGWYASNFGYGTTETGYSTVQSVATFDLIAGHTYTLSYDYSRGCGCGGNGPFPTSLTVGFGSHATSYSDVSGFYYGADWQPGSLSFTQQTTELGAHVVFTALGAAGYSSMQIDNVSLVGLPPAPVPEPSTYALMLAGLAAVGGAARRATRRP